MTFLLIYYCSFSRDVTTNYAMALAPEVGHAGGHLTGRVVSQQRPLGQLHQGLCVLSTVSMGYICAVKNCGHNSARDKGKYRFFRFPAIVVNQGEEIRELSERRRRPWFANIYRKEFNDKKAENSRVCSCHFISGK